MVSADSLSRPAGAANARPGLDLQSTSWAWHALAFGGLLLVFLGLAIDAWTHNAGSAGDESLLSLTNPGHAAAGMGLALSLLGVLGSISLASARHAAVSDRPIAVLAVAAAAWVTAVGSAVGTVTYIAASGTTVGHTHQAVTSGSSGSAAPHLHAAGAHDHGPHATYSES
jgi:hypothetical protein